MNLIDITWGRQNRYFILHLLASEVTWQAKGNSDIKGDVHRI